MNTSPKSVFAQYVNGEYQLNNLLEHLVYEIEELKNQVEKLENKGVEV